jgi:hypothetical protein
MALASLTLEKKSCLHNFFSIFGNEITIIDNYSFIYIHCYVMAVFRHVLILLTLGHSNDGGIGTNIKVVICLL